ncbi:hypothetical protein SAY86_003734 [Trapa natans]|uniref:Uncharacterized protein n=1 Tax=Trapa natans TaxID=22666 RepID=A0AAN7MSP6_TRANT|nr:hypothetical protein SAY86_003734 [Trapa natans]
MKAEKERGVVPTIGCSFSLEDTIKPFYPVRFFEAFNRLTIKRARGDDRKQNMDGLGQSKAKKDKLYCSSRMKPKVLSPTTGRRKLPAEVGSVVPRQKML